MAGSEAAAQVQEAYRRLAGDESDIGAFAAGGPFESFPGPVLIVGANGVVLGSNDPAEALARLVQAGGTPELRDAINAALEGRAAQVNPLLLDGNSRTGESARAYDLMVLPWADAPAALLLARDITLERSLRAALVESRQRYKDILEAACDFVWETDAQGRFTFVSEAGALGFSVPDLIGRSVSEFLVDNDSWQETAFASAVPVESADVWFRTRSDRAVCLSVLSLPLDDADGVWCGCRGLAWDVTAERSHGVERALTENRERLLAHILRVVRGEIEPERMIHAAAQELVRAMPASGTAIFRRDAEGFFKSVAAAGTPVESWPRSDQLGDLESAIKGLCPEGRTVIAPTCFREACNGAVVVWHHNAKIDWTEHEVVFLEEFATQLALVHAQSCREEQFERLCSQDSLTDLLNRSSFIEGVERRLARLRQGGSKAALLYIDIDEFKKLNDTYGHQRGDEALQRVAGLLRRLIRDRDLAGRLGGDEFALLIEEIDGEVALEKARAILAAAAGEDEAWQGKGEKLTLSIGVAIYEPDQAEAATELLARADQAMYGVKRQGKAGVALAPALGEGVPS